MADEPQTVTEGGRQGGFMKELSNAATRKAIAPIAATAATAGTVYMTRKSTELWQEKVVPKVREKGGAKVVARETLEKVADRIGGRGAEALSELAARLGGPPLEDRTHSEEQPTPEVAVQESAVQQPNGQREEARKKRQQHRQQRQRALEKSGST